MCLNEYALKKHGNYEVVARYHNPLKALKDFIDKTFLVDIVFLDIEMPQMTGWEFVESFKKVKESKGINTEIVIVSDSLKGEDLNFAHSIEFIRGVFEKPLNLEVLKRIRA
jgi:DNA-binding NarL/FixJ family response regulator